MKKISILITILCFEVIFCKTEPRVLPPAYTKFISVQVAPTIWMQGDYGVWYKKISNSNQCARTNEENRITRPLIICEGFDVANDMDVRLVYDQVDGVKYYDGGVTESYSYLDRLRDEGFDVIVLNLRQNTNNIEDNAQLFTKLLADIDAEVRYNEKTYGTLYHKPICLGVSMGGLIVRYSLAQYTQKLPANEDLVGGPTTPAEMYISFDVPHKGANIPLSIQQLAFSNSTLSTLSSYTSFIGSLPSFLRGLDVAWLIQNYVLSGVGAPYLVSPAAQQMSMIYRLPNPARTLFLLNQQANGDYPSKMRKVAIACGASGTRQDGIDRNGKLFDLSGGGVCVSKSFNLPWGLGNLGLRYCPFTFGATAYAMPGQLPIADYLPNLTLDMGFGSQLSINDNNISTYAHKKFNYERDLINGPLLKTAVDHVPGGYLSLSEFGMEGLKKAVDKVEVDLSIKHTFYLCCKPVCWQIWKSRCRSPFTLPIDITLLKWRPLGQVTYAKQFSFVPTLSALDIKGEDWSQDLNNIGNYPHNTSTTPFDAIYWNGSNQPHAYMPSVEMAQNLKNEVFPTDLYIQNRTFNAQYGKNTFEADGSIVLGNNVDRIPNRSTFGDVVVKDGATIKLAVPDNGYVYFDDGFDAATSFNSSGYLEVISRPSCSISPFANQTTADKKQYWSNLRTADNETTEQPEQWIENESLTFRLPNGEPLLGEPTSEKTANSKLTMDISPNPVAESSVIKLNIENNSSVNISLLDVSGNHISSILNGVELQSGNYEFDFNALKFKNGLYIVKITTKTGQSAFQKILINK